VQGTMEVYALILVLSVVQSLFGVGILLFGTPIMLLLGYEYHEALLYLLPASAALSWSQVWDYRHQKLDGNYRRLFFLACLPALLIGMLLTSQLNLSWEIKLFVTTMLVLTFLIRSSESMLARLQQLIRSQLPAGLMLMGLIHGLSNMGGSLLTPIVSSLYRDKSKVLGGVSFDYAFMASFQLLVLLVLRPEAFASKFLIGAGVSLLVRHTVGKRIFSFTSDLYYQRLINGLILANALVLGIKLI
jgi:uncharacterized protein